MTRKLPFIAPEEELFRSLARVYHLARKVGERLMEPAGITIGEYNLLRIIENTPDVTAKEAQERLYFTAASVAQLVQSLERKGLIGRIKNKDDARRQHMRLTARGCTVTKKVQTSLTKHSRSILSNPKRIESLVEELRFLTQQLSSSLS